MTIQNQIDEAKEIDSLGREAAGAGDFEKAAGFFGKAAKIFENIDDSVNRALQLFNLANCFQVLKKDNQALSTFRTAYNLIKDREKFLAHQAMLLNNIGLLCVNFKNYDESLSSFEKACGIYETLNNENGKALQLQNIGSVYRDLKKNEKALEMYFKSVAIFQKIENRLGESDQYSNIAYIYVMNNNIDEALKWYKKALDIYANTHEDEKARITKKNIEQLEGVRNTSSDGSMKP